jgi:hypothetical protein
VNENDDCRPPTTRLGDERGGSGIAGLSDAENATERRDRMDDAVLLDDLLDKLARAEPTAAEIEAAARALRAADGALDVHTYGTDARAALVAALPLIEARLREQIAAEIEAAEVAGLEPAPGGLGPAARWGLGLAARIVRGA